MDNENCETLRRILVVDDNQGTTWLLTRLIEKMGPCHVRVAHDGQTAVETCRAFCPHLVLLDLGLPDIDGIEVGRRIRQDAHLAHVVLVAVTGRERSEGHARAKAVGFDQYLVKPPSREQLEPLLFPKNASEQSPDRQ